MNQDEQLDDVIASLLDDFDDAVGLGVAVCAIARLSCWVNRRIPKGVRPLGQV